jgi:hypothetical protein
MKRSTAFRSAAAVIFFSLMSVASAQQGSSVQSPAAGGTQAPGIGIQPQAAPQTSGSGSNRPLSTAPAAQGGTTGGTVNPGVSTDHQTHGSNGG